MVYFDLQLGRYGDAVPLGRVVMELKADVVPRTAENFRALAVSTTPGNGYKGSRFHRQGLNPQCCILIFATTCLVLTSLSALSVCFLPTLCV